MVASNSRRQPGGRSERRGRRLAATRSSRRRRPPACTEGTHGEVLPPGRESRLHILARIGLGRWRQRDLRCRGDYPRYGHHVPAGCFRRSVAACARYRVRSAICSLRFRQSQAENVSACCSRAARSRSAGSNANDSAESQYRPLFSFRMAARYASRLKRTDAWTVPALQDQYTLTLLASSSHGPLFGAQPCSCNSRLSRLPCEFHPPKPSGLDACFRGLRRASLPWFRHGACEGQRGRFFENRGGQVWKDFDATGTDRAGRAAAGISELTLGYVAATRRDLQRDPVSN